MSYIKQVTRPAITVTLNCGHTLIRDEAWIQKNRDEDVPCGQCRFLEDGAAYEVRINGRETIGAGTEKEVWAIIGSLPVGALYTVSSASGMPCYAFIPY